MDEYYDGWVSQSESRARMVSKRLVALQEQTKPGYLLDVGCGLGTFLSLAESFGWQVSGTEVSEFAVSYAKKELARDVFLGNLEKAGFENNYFDVVTLWHVLEHVQRPVKLLAEVKRIIKPGGLVVIEVPNVRYLPQLIKGVLKAGNPYFYICPENNPEKHLSHFDGKTLKRILSRADFHVLNVVSTDVGYHHKSFLRNLKDRFYQGCSKQIYRLTGFNPGVAVRVYARKLN